MVEILVVNNTNEHLLIAPQDWFDFQAKVTGSDRWIIFNGEGLRPMHYIPHKLEPMDTLVVTMNLNLLAFFQMHNIQAAQPLSLGNNYDITLRVRAWCYTNNKYYYTQEFPIQTYVLGLDDKLALDHCKTEEQFPYQFANKSYLNGSGSDLPSMDSMLIKYPTSTFAQMGKLRIAHQKARKVAEQPALRTEILSLLEGPLTSPYSYIRYLAEQLRAKLP